MTRFAARGAGPVYALRVLLIFLSFHTLDARAAPPANPASNPQAYAAYRARAIAAGQARNEKIAADNFFEDGNLEQAAKLYLHALTAAPDAFSFAEKKQIATRLAGAGRQSDASVILQELLAQRKNDLPARLELVKSLVAMQQHTAAFAELDNILRHDGRNRYALLIKADALRRQKLFSESIPVYLSILQQANDFDARLGLVYSLLAVGAKAEAKKHFKLIEAEDEGRQEQLDELAKALNSSTRPRLDLLLNHYEDSDENRSLEHGVLVRVVAGNIDWVADIRNKTAISDAEETRATADTYALSAAANVTDDLRVTGKYGRTKLIAASTVSRASYLLKLDAKLGTSLVTANFSQEALTATPALISNPILVSKNSIGLTQPLMPRFKTNLAYVYKTYSDGNTAQDFRAGAYYAVYHGAPQISVGAGYHRADFKSPTSNGYSAPQDLLGKQVMLTAYYEGERFYMDVNIEYGRESYEKNQVFKDNIFYYTTAAFGVKVTRRLALELGAEKSNSSAAKGAETFDDSVVNARLSYLF